MFKITLKITLPELNRYPIEIQCPRCELHNWVTLAEVVRRDYVICRGCHANILLIDHLGSFQRFIHDFEKAFKDWSF